MDLNALKSAIAVLEALDCKTPRSMDAEPGDFRNVIVRSRDAGVIYGKFAGREGSTINIRDGVQMWKWHAAQGISLIDVATFGVKKSECQFSKASAEITVFNACALIDVTDEAAASIEAV
jgi:hypothetical protein